MNGRGNSKGPLILPRPSNLKVNPFELPSIGPSPSSMLSAVVDGRSQALKVHSQAEKRRRERINEHLSSLRRMIPDARKMDKATLLGSVIDHVKDLKRRASDIKKNFPIPTELNEIVVEARELDGTTNSEDRCFYIRASICCDDRPDLFANLLKAFHGLRLRTMRADITSLGGRVKTVVILCGRNHDFENVCLSSLKENIKDALAKIASFDSGAMDGSASKRQRLLQSYYSNALSA